MSNLLDLLTEVPISALLRERLALQLDRGQASEEEVLRLRHEVAQLKDRLAQLEKELGDCRHQLEQATVSKQFIEHRGVLFKRLPAGNVEDTVYCPECRVPMHSVQSVLDFTCSRCGFVAGFAGDRLQRILRELDSAPPILAYRN